MAIFVAVGVAVAMLLGVGEARASSTVTVQPPAVGTTTACPVVVSGNCRYTTVRDAVRASLTNGTGITWTAGFAGVPATGLQISGVSSVATDDALQSLALSGTLVGGAPVQLTAVWGTAATPVLGITIRPGESSLSDLNPSWSSLADPALADPVVVSTAQAGGVVDLAKLPVSARSFYPDGFASASPGTGTALFAGVDVGETSDPALQNVLTYLGVGSTATVEGTLANSLAPVLSDTSEPAQQAGLSLALSSTTAPGPDNNLPAWLTSRTVRAQLTLPPTGAPAISFGDTLVTSIGGQPNTFTGTFGYDPAAGSKGSISASYAVQSGSTFRAPFGLGALQLSDSALALSSTVGSSPQITADLTSTVTLNGRSFGIAAHLAAGGGTLAGDLSVSGSLSAGDTVDLGNALLGSSVTPDAGSAGDSLTFTSAQFSFSATAGSTKTFALTASTAFRGATADVLASIELPVGGPAKLFLGVHAANLSPATLVADPSPMLAGLTFPHANLFISKGYLVNGQSTEVEWDDLLPAQQAFFTAVNDGEAPESVAFGPTLSFAGTMALPEAVTSRFGITEPVEFSGDLGFGLDSLSSGTAPALGGSLSATLPAMTAGLPGWVSGNGPWTIEIAADSNRNVQLAIDGSISATVDGATYDATVSGALASVGGAVTFELTGSVTGTFDNLFGLSWLSATDPTVSLRLERGAGGNSLSASLRSDLTINGYTVTAEAVISNGTGTSASVTVTSKDSTADIGISNVVSFFGGDVSSLTGLPSASLNALEARVSVTRNSGTAVTVDVVADTSVSFSSGGTPFDSQVLLSLTKPPIGATKVIVGFRANNPVALSDVVSNPEVDFTFPSLAILVANQPTTLVYDSLLPAEQEFFEPFCGDDDSACNDRLQVASGISVVTATELPDELDGVLDQLEVSSSAPVLATGVLPVFGTGTLKLRVSLPAIPASGPDFYQGGQLSLDVSDTGVAFNGTITFNVPKGSSVSTEASCTSTSGVWRTPRGGSSAACYDQVPFTVSAAVEVGPPTSVTLTGGLDPSYRWNAPMGQSWLSLDRATIQFGIQTAPLKLTLGFQIGATVAGKDFSGSILASLGVGGPVGIYPNLEGLRVASGSGLSAQDLVDLANSTGANLSLQDAKLPNIAVRNVLLSFSQVDNPALCLTRGVNIAGNLYINPSADARTVQSSDCGNGQPEVNRSELCALDTAAGCMAGVDVSISAAGVRASGLIGGFSAGPLTFSGAKVDLAISPTTQHLVIAGKAEIQDFAEGSVNLLVGPTSAKFRGSMGLFGDGLQAYMEGSATGNFSNLSSLKNIGSFSITAVLKSEWLNQAGVALSGTLAQLKPVVQALAAIITDLDSGNVLKAMFEIPTAAAKLGVSLPAPYGPAFTTIADQLQKITDGLAVLGEPFQYTLDGVLNGFEMDFPGIPGVVVPATCITTWSNGSCYTTPPFNTIFGTVPGIPGVVTPAGCITTTVNGTCYSIPPIDGPRIPGICDALRQAIPGLSCSTGGIADSLILPALRAIVKSSSGYDIGDIKLKDALNSIQSALSKGQTFSIDCAAFSASATLGSSPTAKVSLATHINAFGTSLTPQMTWNFAPDTSNIGSGISSVLDAILKPNLNLNGSCALPADWNTNPDFPDIVGTVTSVPGQPTTPTTPPPPTMKASLSAPSINEGGTATLNGTISPAPATPQTISVTWGNGVTTSTTTGAGGTFTSSQKFANNTPAGRPSAQYEVKATAGTLSSTAMLTVANVAPANLTATPTAARINEGSSVTVSGSFTDPGADGATVVYTWGDGSTDTRTLAPGVRSFTSPAHVYADNNGTAAGYPVTVTVTDDDLAAATASFTQNVDNVAPGGITVTQLAQPGATCPAGGCPMTTPEQQSVPFSFALADPGTRDTATAVIDWGDGQKDTLPLGTVRTFTINHVWADADINSHPDRRFPIDVRITDNASAAGTSRVFETVTNVPPTDLTACLFAVGTTGGAACPAAATIPEGGTARVQGSFSDLSALDDHVVRIDWGAGWPAAQRYQSLYLPVGTFTYDASRQFGGDGSFPVVVTVSDDDNATATATSTLTVTQVPPTVKIDRTAATTVQGVPAFLTRTGTSLPVSAAAADPGNDPLSVLWDWKDGPTTSTTYPGILKSTPPNPTVAPQNVTDKRAHTWTTPCVYAMSARATDGDGNSATDQADVVVTGTDATWRGAGTWQGLYKTKPTPALLCQLGIVQRMSATFAGPSSKVGSAPVALRTAADAVNVLQPSSSDERQKLRRAIVTMWLDYANGAVAYGQLLDTNGDKRPDTAFKDLMATAESVGLDPSATQAQLKAQRQLLATFVGE